MRRCVAITFVLLTLYWTAAPLLACAIPDRVITAQERECCKHMAEMCGSARMAPSHSCCKREVRTSSTMAVASERQSVPVPHVVAAAASPEPHLAKGLLETAHHQPPGEFPPDTTVLRI